MLNMPSRPRFAQSEKDYEQWKLAPGIPLTRKRQPWMMIPAMSASAIPRLSGQPNNHAVKTSMRTQRDFQLKKGPTRPQECHLATTTSSLKPTARTHIIAQPWAHPHHPLMATS